MTNLDTMKMTEDEFYEAYKKVNAEKYDKKPINSSNLSLEDQLEKYKTRSFGEEETRALHEDAISV